MIFQRKFILRNNNNNNEDLESFQHVHSSLTFQKHISIQDSPLLKIFQKTQDLQEDQNSLAKYKSSSVLTTTFISSSTSLLLFRCPSFRPLGNYSLLLRSLDFFASMLYWTSRDLALGYSYKNIVLKKRMKGESLFHSQAIEYKHPNSLPICVSLNGTCIFISNPGTLKEQWHYHVCVLEGKTVDFVLFWRCCPFYFNGRVSLLCQADYLCKSY